MVNWKSGTLLACSTSTSCTVLQALSTVGLSGGGLGGRGGANHELLSSAMRLSKEGALNVRSAHQACDLWNEIVEKDYYADLPPTVRRLCYALQAECLTRVGRDEDAVEAYNGSLSIVSIEEDKRNDGLESSMRLGKAYALQRLMRYDEAQVCFSMSDDDQAVAGEALCCLRQRDFQGALTILRSRISNMKSGLNAPTWVDLWGTLEFLNADCSITSEMETLWQAETSFLSRWIWSLEEPENMPDPTASDVLELLRVNNGPLDDPCLLRLDDKVQLHDILSDEWFWPKGVVLPRDRSIANRLITEQIGGESPLFILKNPVGYGSHGNRLVDSLSEALHQYPSVDNRRLLCQQVVHPTHLLERRKFSLRLYIYYFPAGNLKSEVYLSKLGLVKLAMEPYSRQDKEIIFQESLSEDIFMTNSGRDQSMIQYNLDALRQDLSVEEFASFWSKVSASIKTVMQRYLESRTRVESDYCAKHIAPLGLPKILGFDYLVTQDSFESDHKEECRVFKPILLEVNRFPGLEPRNEEQDEVVKNRVVRDAWALAIQRKRKQKRNLPPSVEAIPLDQ